MCPYLGPSTRPGSCMCVCVLPPCLMQVIKILGTEKGKKNKTNLIFLAGNRVLKWMERSYGTEKALTTLLKYAPFRCRPFLRSRTPRA